MIARKKRCAKERALGHLRSATSEDNGRNEKNEN
jgi:hypothetical protein